MTDETKKLDIEAYLINTVTSRIYELCIVFDWNASTDMGKHDAKTLKEMRDYFVHGRTTDKGNRFKMTASEVLGIHGTLDGITERMALRLKFRSAELERKGVNSGVLE